MNYKCEKNYECFAGVCILLETIIEFIEKLNPHQIRLF